jgi:hypothetical protein
MFNNFKKEIKLNLIYLVGVIYKISVYLLEFKNSACVLFIHEVFHIKFEYLVKSGCIMGDLKKVMTCIIFRVHNFNYRKIYIENMSSVYFSSHIYDILN